MPLAKNVGVVKRQMDATSNASIVVSLFIETVLEQSTSGKSIGAKAP